MSTITEFGARAPQMRASVLGAAADALIACVQAMLRWPREAMTIEHIESMSDHQLRDIGITRSEIALVVRGADLERMRGRHALD